VLFRASPANAGGAFLLIKEQYLHIEKGERGPLLFLGKDCRILANRLLLNVLAIERRRDLLELFEDFDKIPRFVESQLITDLRYGHVGNLQQLLGPLDLQPCQVGRKVLTGLLSEQPAEITWTQVT